MSFDSLSAVLFTAIFLVPGFVWSSVLSMLVPRSSKAVELRALEFLTLSCINHALWIWLLVPLVASEYLERHPVWTGLALILPVLVSPVALGLFTGWAFQNPRMKGLLGRFLRRFGFRTIHELPTAWDYHFFTHPQPYWVIVTLCDGSRVYGLFGYNSFAGDDAAERDLYLEAVYHPTTSGEWAPIEDSGGIIVKADQVAAVEFRKLTEVSYE